MNSDSRNQAHTLAEAVDRNLCVHGGSERAQKEKAYLKSELLHYGVSVPDTRAVVRAALRGTALDHDEVIELAGLLWAAPTVLECWAIDEDFWIRRSALLAHSVPLRRGRGDFGRFSRFADAMLEEKEFFIRAPTAPLG